MMQYRHRGWEEPVQGGVTMETASSADRVVFFLHEYKHIKFW